MNQDHVFREAGEALFLAQTLELNIRIVISILNQQFHSGIDENLIIYATDKRTLGQLIHEMKKHGDFNQEATDTLSKALKARNYIMHHFFTRNVAVFRDEFESALAMKTLDERKKEIIAATAVTFGLVQGFCQAFKIELSSILVQQGISEEKAEQGAAANP